MSFLREQGLRAVLPSQANKEVQVTDVYERYVARVADVSDNGALHMNVWRADEDGEPIVERSDNEPTMLASISPGTGVTIKGNITRGDIVRVSVWEDADGSQVIIEAE